MESKSAAIKARVEALREEAATIRSSSAYKRVVGLLSGLGFLTAPGVAPSPGAKVDLSEAIRVGLAVEPRIIEVLPAAVLSYPKTFLHGEHAPPIFREIVAALRSGKEGPDFGGISFEKFLEAANRPTKSKKRKTLKEKRVPKTFRLSPDVIEAMTERAKSAGIDFTAYIEGLIRSDARRQ